MHYVRIQKILNHLKNEENNLTGTKINDDYTSPRVDFISLAIIFDPGLRFSGLRHCVALQMVVKDSEGLTTSIFGVDNSTMKLQVICSSE
jgi:hypothetical protein